MFLFLVTPYLVVAVQPCIEWIPIKRKNKHKKNFKNFIFAVIICGKFDCPSCRSFWDWHDGWPLTVKATSFAIFARTNRFFCGDCGNERASFLNTLALAVNFDMVKCSYFECLDNFLLQLLPYLFFSGVGTESPKTWEKLIFLIVTFFSAK